MVVCDLNLQDGVIYTQLHVKLRKGHKHYDKSGTQECTALKTTPNPPAPSTDMCVQMLASCVAR